MKLYLNGWLMGTDSYTGGFDRTVPPALFRLGDRVTLNDPPSGVRGFIDEVRVWKRELTQAEIKANLHRRLTGNEPDLAGLWNFENGAQDSGPSGWHGKLRGKARADLTEIPGSIGVEEVFLDARVRESNGSDAKSVILEAFQGTNLVTARLSRDGIFKAILPVTNAITLRFSHLLAHTEASDVRIPAGDQHLLRVDLPPPRRTAENTNIFAVAVNHLLSVDPAALERLDTEMIWGLMPLLRESEGKMLSLFQSPDANHRRFIAMLLEKARDPSLTMVTALAGARHDKDEIVRGLAQNSLQSLPIPKEFEAFYTKRKVAVAGLFAGLLVPFALIHFFLFVLYPAKLSNLYYGVFAGAAAYMIYFGAAADADTAAVPVSTLAFMTLGLLVLDSLFYRRLPLTFWTVLAVAAVAIGALLTKRQEIASFSSIMDSSVGHKRLPLGTLAALGGGYVAFFIVLLEMLRVVLRSVWRGQEGAWLVGTGFLLLVLAGIGRAALYISLFAGKISADVFAKYSIYFPNAGAAGFVICGSIYLAKVFSQSFAQVRTAKVEIEKKNAELMMARDVALSANQAKSQFLANMSHELRTPLNAIIGYSELVSEQAADEGQKQYLADLEKITAAAKHQLMLVNDILDLSKIEAGKMTLKLEEFGVKEIIHEIRIVVAPLIAKKRNRLELECPGTVCMIRADSMKVRQVLFNLLSNAAKFTENGVITLRVAAVTLNGAPAISFVVSDTGIGMTPEQAGRLFQAFTQAEAGIHQKYGGTGLGLVISKRFCEIMGGALTVESEFGKGSTFTATLPIRVAEISG
jgi:signal transduction histidine kinase